jgi:SAM-dependent methyltransferase
MLKKLLAHPLTCGLDIDSPETTRIRAEIIKSKPFLNRVYKDWYRELLAEIPKNIEGDILELGSGGGFLKNILPEVITTDFIFVPTLDTILDAHHLPFSENTFKAILMTNVLHHFSHVESFFREAARCVNSGGVVAMIEPWVSSWSRLVYTQMHHEPFYPDIKEWDIPIGGHLSAANSALPWIIFERDREKFNSLFPDWNIHKIDLMMPFRYLVSGGVSFRSLMPLWTYKLWKTLEEGLHKQIDRIAMFAKVVLIRR